MSQAHIERAVYCKFTRVLQEVAQESLRSAHEQRLSLEESLERRSREAAALHQHNCALRQANSNALAELQVLLVFDTNRLSVDRLGNVISERK